MEKIKIEGLRLRLNAKSTAKGLWYFDATIESESDKLTESVSNTDLADIRTSTLGERILKVIKDAEDVFVKDGRTVIGRNDSADIDDIDKN